MASLQNEFPELTQKIFDALRPIADIAHGDSSQVVASVVLSSVLSAFVVLLQQDLIYAGAEASQAALSDTPVVPKDNSDAWVAALSDASTPVSEVPLRVTETDLGPATATEDLGTVAEPVTETVDLGSVADPVDSPQSAMPDAAPLEAPAPGESDPP